MACAPAVGELFCRPTDYSVTLGFFSSDFSFLDIPEGRSEASIRPHGFLEERKFLDSLKSMAKDALRSFAGSLKDVLVGAIKPMLPKITDAAVRVFKQACEEAEERVQEA